MYHSVAHMGSVGTEGLVLTGCLRSSWRLDTRNLMNSCESCWLQCEIQYYTADIILSNVYIQVS